MNVKYAMVSVLALMINNAWSMTPDFSRKQYDQLNFIYAAHDAHQLDRVDGDAAIALLEQHIEWLGAQKSNYNGFFTNSKLRFLGKAFSGSLFLASLSVFGLDLLGSFIAQKALNREVGGIFGDSGATPTANNSSFHNNLSLMSEERKREILGDYVKNHKYRSVVEMMSFVAALGLSQYIQNSVDKMNKDVSIDKQIKRDDEIILQLKQLKRVSSEEK